MTKETESGLIGRVQRAVYDNHYCSQCGLHRTDATVLLNMVKVTVRALECIYRFTLDNYAKDALREVEKHGWSVDWHGHDRKGGR